MSGHLAPRRGPASGRPSVHDPGRANLTTHKGHLGRVHAYLLIGTDPANYDATFVESEPFLVLP